MTAKKIGIIVIGRNEGQRLIDCLSSVKGTGRTVIYVDSGSSDGSPDAAARLGALVVGLDMSQPFTAARGRNAGFAALKSCAPNVEYVQFVDGDCVLENDWINTAVEFIEACKNVAVVCGRRRERYPERSIYNQLCDIEWNTPIGEALACGGDALMRVASFEAVGGFRGELIAGEEPELCLRLRQGGWKIWRIDVEMTRHDAAITRFSQWWRRAVRSGYGYAAGWQRTKNSSEPMWRRELIRAIVWGGGIPIFVLVGALLEPWIALGILLYPMQICRIAMAHPSFAKQAWSYAALMTAAKFAELQGIATYYGQSVSGQAWKLIEYKS